MLQIVVLDNEANTVVRLSDIPSGCLPYLKSFLEDLGAGAGPGRPGMPVVVTAVDETELAAHSTAQPVTMDQTFPSAMALSMHLGFKFNSVGQALGRAAREMDKKAQEAWQREGHAGKHTSRLRPQGTIRGVTFMYEKDLPG